VRADPARGGAPATGPASGGEQAAAEELVGGAGAGGAGQAPAGGALGAGREEVEFFRRSLVDLDAELAAGDLSPRDHARLHDEYTARLARALRGTAPTATLAASAARGGRGVARRALAIFGVVAFAVGAGVLVAQASGTRTLGDEMTGAIRAGSRAELERCLELAAAGSALEALQCYDGVLRDHPSNAEALAYRGWTLVRVGDPRVAEQARANLDAAVAVAPDYADARVFRAVLALRQGRPAEARDDLEALDALAPPVGIRALVDQFQLRERVAEALAAEDGATGPAATGG
jgi:tetratricopeptide (TPR) repeat protein